MESKKDVQYFSKDFDFEEHRINEEKFLSTLTLKEMTELDAEK